MANTAKSGLLGLTARIISAHVSNNQVAAASLPALIETIYNSLEQHSAPSAAMHVERAPAVPVDSSVQPDRIICLEDGKAVKLLKPYLMRRHRLTPEQYRAKWNLPADYPMVAPSCTAQRRDVATKHGLGRTSAKQRAATPSPAANHSTADQPAAARVVAERSADARANASPAAPGRTAKAQPAVNKSAIASPGNGPSRRVLGIVVPGGERRDARSRSRSKAVLGSAATGPRRQTAGIAVPDDTPRQDDSYGSVEGAVGTAPHPGSDGLAVLPARSGAGEQPARS